MVRIDGTQIAKKRPYFAKLDNGTAAANYSTGPRGVLNAAIEKETNVKTECFSTRRESANKGLVAKGRFLLVDDEPSLRRLAEVGLTEAGFSVTEAVDGQEGWERLRLGDFDVLITDLDMPRLNGLELVRKLRDEGYDLPVIVVTGSSELNSPNDVPELRLHAVLHKPYIMSDLVSAAEEAMHNTRSSRFFRDLNLSYTPISVTSRPGHWSPGLDGVGHSSRRHH